MALLLPSENPLLYDPEIADKLSDDHFLATLLRFEKTLARCQGELQLIPNDAADALQHLSLRSVDHAALAHGMRRDGVVVPTLLRQLGDSVSAQDAQWLHFGVTSQDAIDTSIILMLREMNQTLLSRLDAIVRQMAGLADRTRKVRLMARTRQRPAVPTCFGNIAVSWLAPLLRQRKRFQQMIPGLYRLQLGGAGGHLSAIDRTRAWKLVQRMGEAMELHYDEGPWHNQRDNLVEYGNWLAMICGNLAKIAEDLIVLSADGVSEVSVRSDGKSSTMPQKQNPVMLEHVVTLGKMVAAHQVNMQQALVNVLQRDGRSWMLEWLILPAMVMATGTALHVTGEILSGLRIHPDRMTRNIVDNLGLVFAEAATSTLIQYLKPAQARLLIAEACERAASSGEQLLDVLAADSRLDDFGINWKILDDDDSPGLSDEFIQRVLDSVEDKS